VSGDPRFFYFVFLNEVKDLARERTA